MFYRSGLLIPILLMILSYQPSEARVWLLNADGTGDAPTIAAAMDSAAGDGDVIVLADGIYCGPGNHNLSNSGKWLLLRSQSNHPEDCVIDLQGSPDDPHFGLVFADDG